jgi:hypothetical protein
MADVKVLSNYSAHADYLEINKFLECQNPKKVKKIFLVNGEKDVQFDFKEYLNIFSELVLVKSMFIALILFFIVIYNFFLKYNKFLNAKMIIFNNDFDKLFFINSLICFLYFIFLFFIFLFSNIDLNINEFLEAGSFRYTNPISFSLCYFSILVLFNREKKLYFK